MIEQTIKNLNRRGFIAKSISRDDLLSALMDIIDTDAKIGCGGSMTLDELRILSKLQNEGYLVLSLETSDMPWEQLCSESRNVDVYLSSSNAISMEGYLVNIDGRGNRVANMIYGVPTVVIIAGSNKIEENLDKAIYRAKNVAAPKNCVRLKRNTPCVKSGRCMDCDSPERICRAMVVSTNPTSKTKVYVFIIDEKLGY